MGTTTGLVTVAEFERTPNPKNGCRQELHHGEVVETPPPKKQHSDVQGRLNRILVRLFDDSWYVQPEFPFQIGGCEVWVADLGMTSAQRWEVTPGDRWFGGAPELIIEVLSPSNTASEIYDRERTCLEGGCREFWVVDPEHRRIYVSTAEHASRAYNAGDEVPVFDRTIRVDDIFAR